MSRPNQEPEQRPNMRAEPRMRARTISNETDEFYIDPASIPDGMSVEWKRATTFGMEDVDHQMRMAAQGWEPATAKLFPHLMPKGINPNKPVIRGGMMLMERPMELTAQAREEDYRNAVGLVSDNEGQLGVAPSGTGPRDHQQVAPRIGKEVLAVPE